jgi:hypothetical protein
VPSKARYPKAQCRVWVACALFVLVPTLSILILEYSFGANEMRSAIGNGCVSSFESDQSVDGRSAGRVAGHR